MKAMILEKLCRIDEDSTPLTMKELVDPEPQNREILLRVKTCGVCHTELDEIEGRTPPPNLPIVLGHQVIGEVVKLGPQASKRQIGDRVGVAWIYSVCNDCEFCKKGEENLCASFQATGRDANGGYAEFMTVPEEFAYPIPELFSDAQAAPHLCAGAIGYRSLKLTGLQNGQRLGLTGFGASAHIVLMMVKKQFPDSQVFVFARNEKERQFALELGAVWAGDTAETAPQGLNCIIDTTPVWKPIVEALKNLMPGGRLVINAIRKERVDIEVLLNLEYPTHLWFEKEIKSVANVTRSDVVAFLNIAADIPILPEVQEYPFDQANTALVELKQGKIRGAKVLRIA